MSANGPKRKHSTCASSYLLLTLNENSPCVELCLSLTSGYHVARAAVRSLSSGTFIGPADGAVPGAGCGKAVERAVWKVTLPSTFCIT